MMKFAVISALCVASVMAQQPAPAPKGGPKAGPKVSNDGGDLRLNAGAGEVCFTEKSGEATGCMADLATKTQMVRALAGGHRLHVPAVLPCRCDCTLRRDCGNMNKMCDRIPLVLPGAHAPSSDPTPWPCVLGPFGCGFVPNSALVWCGAQVTHATGSCFSQAAAKAESDKALADAKVASDKALADANKGLAAVR